MERIECLIELKERQHNQVSERKQRFSGNLGSENKRSSWPTMDRVDELHSLLL